MRWVAKGVRGIKKMRYRGIENAHAIVPARQDAGGKRAKVRAYSEQMRTSAQRF
jgi:hypothetical protein